MDSLDCIAQKYGTDKASKHPTIAGHDYCRFYEQAFADLRLGSLKVLEIGVGGGESIRTWIEFFPHAQIFGVDIVSGTNPWNTVNAGTHERYRFITGDQSSEVFWKCFLADYGPRWDIVIEDGGHCNYQVIPTFNALWPQIDPGGMYCIEDLAVGYGAGSVFVRGDFPRHMEFISQLMDKINWGQDDIDSMTFARELCILKKKQYAQKIIT